MNAGLRVIDMGGVGGEALTADEDQADKTHASRKPDIGLMLYVSSLSVHAPQTIDGIVRICRELGEDRVGLTIVDVVAHPELAEAAGVVATPTLIRSDQTLSARVVGEILDPYELSNRILPELIDLPPSDMAEDSVIGRINCA